MNLDLDRSMDEAERAVGPWSFTLQVGGADFPTRPVGPAELETMRRLAELGPEERRAFFQTLIDGDVSGWDVNTVEAATVAIVGYCTERSREKSRRLRDIVARQAAAAR